MDADLRRHFDRAVDDDPGADPGAMAYAAISAGGRIRRRRKLTAVAGVAAGVAAALGVAVGVHLQSPATRPADPPVTVAAAMRPMAAPACSAELVEDGATDVAMFLTQDVTDRQRSALRTALDDDARVDVLHYESREQAYQRFRTLWADSPEFVAAVRPDQLPESFRLRLVNPSDHAAFHAEYAAMDGVQDIIGRVCPASAPVGGVL